jgi:S-adenosylmethionine-diacylglycerol 3-amino-3-carboxypropyl transferase
VTTQPTIAYGQCWEDADVLLAGLGVRPGDTCLSIASAGDNTLALLAAGPARVIAIDCNAAQLACLALRVAAYRCLGYSELLEFYGSRPSARRLVLYERCRPCLDSETREFWDARRTMLQRGLGHVGRFERYVELFRRWLLPLVHGRGRIDRLLQGGTTRECESFYARQWDNWRWRMLFRLFFSRPVMARLGRDRRCFDFAPRSIADSLLERMRATLARPQVAENPYIQWLLTGQHRSTLPFALRPENFQAIRANLDRLEWRCARVEDYLKAAPDGSIDRFNLSNVFEYLAEGTAGAVLRDVARVARPGGRAVYWNLFAARERPTELADRLQSKSAEARALEQRAGTFFYSRLIVEEALHNVADRTEPRVAHAEGLAL